MILAFPVNVFAEIKSAPDSVAGFDFWTVTSDEFVVEIPKGSTGTFFLKTPSGSTTFSYQGKRFGRVRVTDYWGRIQQNKGTFTFVANDGSTSSGGAPIDLISSYYNAHNIKSFQIKVTVSNLEYDAKVFLKEFWTFEGSGPPTNPGGGDTNPNPGSGDSDEDSGNDPGEEIAQITINYNDGTISWDTLPLLTTRVKVYKNGVYLESLSKDQKFYSVDGPGLYTVQALDPDNNIIGTGRITVSEDGTATPDPGGGDPPDDGGTDPGDNTGECGEGCQQLKDALECPEFDEYLGKWADMIRSTYPPPPDWNYVADVMTNHIVPAMGAELVYRAPVIAEIIADEFESREKPVSPPPDVPTYHPNVPRFEDTPSVRGNLNQGVPNFTPDYSQDKAFNILDPAQIDFSDNSDKGYTYQQLDTTTPEYKAGADPSDADPGYNTPKPGDIDPPDYHYAPSADTPAPDYRPGDGGPEEMPDYGGSEGDGEHPVYQYPEETVREYQGR